MAGNKANRMMTKGVGAWAAGVSVAALTALCPAAAKASTHHSVSHVSHVSHIAHSTVHHSSSRVAHETHHISTHVATHETHRVSSHVAQSHHEISRTHEASRRDAHELHHVASRHLFHRARIAAEYRHSYIQCVPYAREVSHIQLSGDAFLWWAEAAGRYQRGDTPKVGAVLNFRSIGRMPLGHVAVVTAVLDPRTILVTQANWVPGSITNDVTVQDVSADNNWSAVQVELGDTRTMGSTYPTYGFIYNHADTGTVIAATGNGRNEVAEAPVARPVAAEAPNRNLQ